MADDGTTPVQVVIYNTVPLGLFNLCMTILYILKRSDRFQIVLRSRFAFMKSVEKLESNLLIYIGESLFTYFASLAYVH